MNFPIILQADDGVSWWTDPLALELSIESPDIENGIYSAWDSLGQVLEILPSEPLEKRTVLGLRIVSVTSSKLRETGRFHPSELISTIRSYLAERFPSVSLTDSHLSASIELLCSLQKSNSPSQTIQGEQSGGGNSAALRASP